MAPSQPLRVAIIGAGPAGLGALIALSKVDGVDVQVYEQAQKLREIGAGISVQNNGWRVLDKLDVPPIPPESYFRNSGRKRNEHWNGRNGSYIKAQLDPEGIPDEKLHIRTHRARLQEALLKAAPQERIHLKKRLSKVDFLPTGGAKLTFEDGFTATVDLVVGADGIRSAVRRWAFPEHTINYTGRIAYRTVFPISLVESIPDFPHKTIFWHGEDGRWIYTSPLGDGLFEITASTLEPKELGEAVSWGQPAEVQALRKHFTEFHPVVRAIIEAVPPETLGQYATFSGPQLESIVRHGSVALLGDASHPLAGAFGAGAAFALEDAWTLAQSVSYTLENSLPLAEGLRLFDKTRSPYYGQLFSELKSMAAAAEKGKHLPWDERVADRIEERWGNLEWIYSYDVETAWNDTLREEASIQQQTKTVTRDEENQLSARL
ncbi:putative monooxygenase [Lentinus tigrinus ALCF2SS1-7]|uniref:putative monooxygenase n=1 Tax=Lentinus tigrinus ALCF2SS1-7 TaxID=1328758 RepID=UPI0011662C1A|nr:putative monooxygenase [Lentinus tigrinus ALCF2SS1-7]